MNANGSTTVSKDLIGRVPVHNPLQRAIDRWFLSPDAWGLHLLLPVAFVLLMVLFHPFRETFQIDTDEGINLIKAVLVLDGHRITGDIDTDQPPLLSNLLALVFRLMGQSVNLARMVLLLFSGLLLGAAGMATQIAFGRGSALLVYLILILLPNYLTVSISVMIGQPSIALAMLAMLCIFLWHRCCKWTWLVLAGVFMSLSLFMKIFTVILLPVFGVGLLVAAWIAQGTGQLQPLPRRWFAVLKPAVIFTASLVASTLLLLLWMVDLENVMMLIAPHLVSRDVMQGIGSITADLKPALIPILLGVVGLGYSIAERRWLGLYPAAWAVVAFLSLLNHSPIWWHHQMLVTIPIAILAAFGIFRIFQGFWESDRLPGRGQKWVVFCGLLVFGAFLYQQTLVVADELGGRPPSLSSYGLDPESGDMRILSKMQILAEEGALIVTDMPMFAVRAKMRVPVELSWVSDKLLRSGFLTEVDFIEGIEQEQPELILIARYPLSEVHAYLQENPDYEEVYSTKIHTGRKGTLYARRVP